MTLATHDQTQITPMRELQEPVRAVCAYLFLILGVSATVAVVPVALALLAVRGLR